MQEINRAGGKLRVSVVIPVFNGAQTIQGLTVEPVDRLEDTLQSSDITTAVVAVPPQYAQGVVDRLADAGVSTILNYAAIEVRAPPQVQLLRVDAIRAFQSSTYVGV